MVATEQPVSLQTGDFALLPSRHLSQVKCLGPPPSNSEPPRLKELPCNVLRDQEFLWVPPFRLKQADLPWVAGLVGTTADLIAIDRRVGQELSESPPGTGFAFSHHVVQVGSAAYVGVPSAFYLLGRWRSTERARTAGVLGFRALADSLIVVGVLKSITQRPRPTREGGRVRNHNADGEFFTGGFSFPSGHAGGGWALATVVSCQYSYRRWMPPLAYGLASLVSVARMTERQHFPSDTFVGGALGYMIGRHVCHEARTEEATTSRRWHIAPALPSSSAAALTLVWEF